jgi:hypothetical protein
VQYQQDCHIRLPETDANNLMIKKVEAEENGGQRIALPDAVGRQQVLALAALQQQLARR